MRSLVLVTLFALAGVARAQAPGDVPANTAPEKSVATALDLSIGTTALGAAALVATAATSDSTSPGRIPLFAFGSLAMLVGPSVGRFYAHHYLSGGQVVRAVGLTVMVLGDAIVASCVGGGPARCQPNKQLLAPAPILAGGTIMLLGALWEIARTEGDVHEYNRDNGFEPALVLAPVRTPEGTTPGIALAGSF